MAGTGSRGSKLGREANLYAFLPRSVTGLVLLTGCAARAKIAITVDKNAQLMTVGSMASRATSGRYRPACPLRDAEREFQDFRMEEDHYSKEFDEAPMPHAIFFTKLGHAIHGTVRRTVSAARPVRLRAAVARQRRDAVCAGRRKACSTLVTLTGSSQVAPARNPRPRAGTAVARRDLLSPLAILLLPAIRSCWTPRPGMPGQVAPLVDPRIQPQAQADNGYIYPADGTSNETRYPPPPSRRALEQHRSIRASGPFTTIAAMGRNTHRRATGTSRGRMYQPRGLFTYQD